MKLYRTIAKEGIFHREELLTPGNEKSSRERGLINIYDEVTYQQLLGIGGVDIHRLHHEGLRAVGFLRPYRPRIRFAVQLPQMDAQHQRKEKHPTQQ